MVAKGPRRKRLTGKQRLLSAKVWVPTYTGKNLLRGYCRWYGVDRGRALSELACLGVVFDEAFVLAVKHSEESRVLAKRKKRELRKLKVDGNSVESWLLEDCSGIEWGACGEDADETALCDVSEIPF